MEAKKYYVYQLKSSFDDFPFYIGKGQKYRMYQHLQDAKRSPLTGNRHKKSKILQTIKRGGWIKYRILFETENEEKVYEREIEEIVKWRDQIGDKLTNLCDGGEGGGIVYLVEIDRERREVAQSLFNRRPDGPGGPQHRPPLGGNDDVTVGLPRRAEGTGQTAFRATVAVRLRCVEPIDAAIQRRFHDLVGLLRLDLRPNETMDALPLRELPRPQPNGSDLDVGLA